MSDIKLRDFLTEGAIIRTKLCDSHSWSTNVVYAINDEYIEIDIGLEKNYIDNFIMTGDTIKCKYATDHSEYTLIGWVTRIKSDFPQSITIRVHQIESFENNRDSYRYDVYLSATVKMGKDDKKGIFAIVTNISHTGVAFITREDLWKGANLQAGPDPNQNVCMYVDVYISPERFFTFEGVLVRKSAREKGIEYGVRYVDMEVESEKFLNVLLEELANKDKEFYNKRSGFWSKNSKYQ